MDNEKIVEAGSATRWKPGQSGNPKGRKKESEKQEAEWKMIALLLAKILTKEIK